MEEKANLGMLVCIEVWVKHSSNPGSLFRESDLLKKEEIEKRRRPLKGTKTNM